MSPATLKNIHSGHLGTILIGPTGMRAVRDILIDSQICDLGEHALVRAHRELLVVQQGVWALPTSRVVRIFETLNPASI